MSLADKIYSPWSCSGGNKRAAGSSISRSEMTDYFGQAQFTRGADEAGRAY